MSQQISLCALRLHIKLYFFIINRYNRADINQHYMERDSVQNIKIEHSKRKGVSSFVLSNDTPLLRVL